MFPMALAAASAGVFVRRREVVWGVVSVAAVTMVLTLRANDEKPLNVWGKPRWWVQSRVGGRDNGELDVIRFAEESIPTRARVGLTIRPQDWSYPFFGARLARTVRFVPSDAFFRVRSDMARGCANARAPAIRLDSCVLDPRRLDRLQTEPGMTPDAHARLECRRPSCSPAHLLSSYTTVYGIQRRCPVCQSHRSSSRA